MSPESFPFLCFPGFLGLPSDFETLRNITPELRVVDVCGSDAPLNGQSWQQWENRLLEGLNKRYYGRKVVLVGYSMGARLILNILNKRLDWIQAAVLISCHPGLSNLREREERAESDLNWALKFREEPWGDLISSWNSQPSLQNSSALKPQEIHYRRATLARVLDVFSLSKQPLNRNKKILVPTMICWGQKDTKFKDLSKALRDRFPIPNCQEIPESGHRVLLDNPTFLTGIIKSFIATC